jgi:phosphonate transport system permease protein
MNLLRSVEVLILALMMVVVVGIGPFAGVLAVAIHGVGALGKLYSEAIESIDPGPIEAIVATGAHPAQVVAYGVLPQVTPQFVAFTLYRWDMLHPCRLHQPLPLAPGRRRPLADRRRRDRHGRRQRAAP